MQSENSGLFNRAERFEQSTHTDLKNDIAFTITTRPGQRPTDNYIKDPKLVVEPTICASRGRENGQELEIKADGTSNTITTVQKDNYLIIPEKTLKGYTEAREGDGVYINRPHQKRGVVQNQMIQTLKTSGDDIGVVVKNHVACELRVDEGVRYFADNVMGALRTTNSCGDKHIIESHLRIRKLTPLECWRLMGITDTDFTKAEKVCSNSQLYKQAGNGIVVDVFESIVRNLI